MASVDDRVVAMQFDNKAFEERISTTITSLDKLKSSIDNASKAKGLENLQASASKFNLDGIASAVDGISSHFSAMGVVAFTVISNIVNHAVDAGVQLGKSLSLDQVISGFREYETNMNSIQTVMANTSKDGTTLQDVNKALDTLNTYSDQTIYNFSQMARNVGTFTAAGVKLDTSVNAIKGIANLAAVSGSNADQASTAMYQLSQALASGKVKLMDWNSVVNAGMGGKVFQEALFNTGKALGTIKDVPIDQTFQQWTDAGHTFRDSLESGWITSEVLTNTLQGFTGDLTEAQIRAMGYTEAQTADILAMGKTAKEAATKVKTFTQLVSTVKESIGSGWGMTFRLIFGDFEEARVLFSGINGMIGAAVAKSAKGRNDLLKGWHDLGGRDVLIQALLHMFEDLAEILKPIGEAFHEVFPPMTAQRLYDLTVKLRDFMTELRPSQGTLTSVKFIFKGIFSLFAIGIDVVKGIAGVFGDLFDRFAGADANGSGGLLGWLANIGATISGLKQRLVDGGEIADFFKKLPDLIGKFFDSLSLPTSFDAVLANIKAFKDLLVGVFDNLNIPGFDKIKTFFGGLFDNVDLSAFEGVKGFFSNISDSIGKIHIPDLDKIKDFFSQFGKNYDPQVTNSMSGGFKTLGDRLQRVKDVLSKVGDMFGWVWDQMKKVGGIFSWVWDKLTALKDFIVGIISSLWDSFKNIGPLLSSAIHSQDFDRVMELVHTALEAGFLGVFSKFQKDGLKVDLTGGFLTNLADSTKKIGDGIGLSLRGLTGSLDGLTGSLKAMQTGVRAKALLDIAKALGLLTVSIVVLSMIDAGALAAALAAMAGGFSALVVSMTLLDKLSGSIASSGSTAVLAVGIAALAGAMLVLSVAVKIFATMSWGEIAKGMTSVVALMGIMVLAAKPLSSNSGGMIRAGIGITAIAIAMNILAGAMKIFATMSWEEMAKGLLGVAGGLAAITLSMRLIPNGMVTKGAGLILVGIALNIIAASAKVFATMDWATMARGMAGMAASLLIIAGAMELLPNGALLALQGAGLLMIGIGLVAIASAIKLLGNMSWGDMIKGLTGIAAALLILAGAMYLMESSIGGAITLGIIALSLGKLADGILRFAAISWGDLLHGLGALAITLGVLAAAGILLEPAVLSLLGLGAAMLLIGAGFVLIGAGADLLATAFGIIATAGTQGVKVLLEALDGFIKRIPDLIAGLGQGIIELVAEILKALPGILKSLGKVIGAVLDMLVENVPKVGELVRKIILEALKTVREVIPDVVATGFKILMSFLDGIRDNIFEITKTVADIITRFFDALSLKVPEIVDSILHFLWVVVKTVALKLAELGKFLGPYALDVLKWLLDGIKKGGEFVLQWFKDLPGNILGWLGDLGGLLLDVGGFLLAGLWTGISNGAGAVKDFFTDLPGHILEWLGDLGSLLLELGGFLLGGLWTGIDNGAGAVKDFFTDLPGHILEWLGDLGSWLKEKGGQLLGGMRDGLTDAIGAITDFFTSLPGKIWNWLGDLGSYLKNKGIDIALGFLNGVIEKATSITNWFSELPGKVLGWIGDLLTTLKDKGIDLALGLLNGIVEKAVAIGDWFRGLGATIGGWVSDAAQWLVDTGKHIIEGLWDGIWKAKDWLLDKVKSLAGWLPDWVQSFLGISSPSKVFAEIGGHIVGGLILGIDNMKTQAKESSEGLAAAVVDSFNPDIQPATDNLVSNFQKAIDQVRYVLANSDSFNPTITPILDLSNVERNAGALSRMLNSGTPFSADLSLGQANAIATTSSEVNVPVEPPLPFVKEVSFTQINQSPTALSTADIYRQTNNQIALAKKELTNA